MTNFVKSFTSLFSLPYAFAYEGSENEDFNELSNTLIFMKGLSNKREREDDSDSEEPLNKKSKLSEEEEMPESNEETIETREVNTSKEDVNVSKDELKEPSKRKREDDSDDSDDSNDAGPSKRKREDDSDDNKSELIDSNEPQVDSNQPEVDSNQPEHAPEDSNPSEADSNPSEVDSNRPEVDSNQSELAPVNNNESREENNHPEDLNSNVAQDQDSERDSISSVTSESNLSDDSGLGLEPGDNNIDPSREIAHHTELIRQAKEGDEDAREAIMELYPDFFDEESGNADDIERGLTQVEQMLEEDLPGEIDIIRTEAERQAEEARQREIRADIDRSHSNDRGSSGTSNHSDNNSGNNNNINNNQSQIGSEELNVNITCDNFNETPNDFDSIYSEIDNTLPEALDQILTIILSISNWIITILDKFF